MTGGWYTYGHDTGHTNVNDVVDGPVDIDQEWKLRVDVQQHLTPVVSGDSIYVTCSDRQVSAFSVDGDGLWSYTHPSPEQFSQVDFEYDRNIGTATNPVVDGEAVYHVVNDRCVSLDASDGTRRWSTLLSTESGYHPRGALQKGPRGRLYVAYRDKIHILERDSGVVERSEPTEYLLDSPVVDADASHLLYLDSGRVIHVVDTQSRAPQWRYPESGNDRFLRCRTTTDGLVILGENGRFRALDLETGNQRWSASGKYSGKKFLPHSPSGYLFATTNDGHLEALELTTGAVRWSVNLQPDEGFPIRGTNQNLYLQNEEEIVRRDPESGAIKEQVSVGFNVRNFVVTQDAIVAIGGLGNSEGDWLTLLGGRDFGLSSTTDTEVFDSGDGAGSAPRVYGDDGSYCPNCGADLAETSNPNFCPQCGTEL